MKRVLIIFVVLICIMTILPLIIVFNFGGFYNAKGIDGEIISVYIKSQDKVVDMQIGEYLKGVVAAEMPAAFNQEALKAQAVAARSYLKSRIDYYKKNETPPEHKGALICTDPTHCKAWISETDRKALWDEANKEVYWEKICKSVDETRNVLMTYKGENVTATFFSTSSGKTESAVNVWGSDVPYLQSVESKGDELSPRFNSNLDISIEDFKKKISDNVKDINWDNGLIGDIKRSDAGGIVTIVVGGVSIKGTQFRTIFELQSTNIQIQTTNEKVQMTLKGYGHGVGMSQYGANYLASQGKNYVDILKTYYTGIDVK